MTADPAHALPAAGDVIAGKYRIVRLVKVGGMGAVFVAQHQMLGEDVALKLLLEGAMADANASARFLHEARAAAKIRGDHVVRVQDFGILEDGRPYMAMELLEGEDLASLLSSRGPLPPATVVDFLLQGMEAIAQAHALGVVHRDLKPSNFFLATHPDGSRVVKVLDFGIAKTTGGSMPAMALTSTKAVVGSPLYMSPEQLRRSRDADAQSDIWSLGVVAFELLTGKPPFTGESFAELVLAVAEQTPAPVHTLRSGLPVELSAVVAKCLQRDRATRYRTVVDLARALRPFASAAGAEGVDRVAAAYERASSRVSPGEAPVPTGSGPAPVTGPGPMDAPRTDQGEALQATVSAQTQRSWEDTAARPQRRRRRYVFAAIGGGASMGILGTVIYALAHTAAPVALSPPASAPVPAAAPAPRSPETASSVVLTVVAEAAAVAPELPQATTPATTDIPATAAASAAAPPTRASPRSRPPQPARTRPRAPEIMMERDPLVK